MKLRDHPKLREQWPPGPGGAVGRGTRSPLAGEDVLEQVFYFAPVAASNANVALQTKYDGHQYTRDIFLEDADFAEWLSRRLQQEVGRTVRDITELDID